MLWKNMVESLAWTARINLRFVGDIDALAANAQKLEALKARQNL